MCPRRSWRRALSVAAGTMLLFLFVGGGSHILSADSESQGGRDMATAGAVRPVDEGNEARSGDADNRGPRELEKRCAPMDAHTSSDCGGAIVGVIWDGRRCGALLGCHCEGADCNKVHSDMESCYRDRGRDCFKCAKMDVRSASPCETKDGPLPTFFWNGTECELFEACSCVGADCDRLFGLFEETLCEAAYGSCKSP
jgi:hypothetical protein